MLDASVAIAWCLEAEHSELADVVLDQLRLDDALVPSIWPMEVSNSLLTAERDGRIAQSEIATVIDWLTRLPIHVQGAPLGPAVIEVLSIARATNLSAYDASYLHLAQTTDLPLATLDGPLRSACQWMGVRTVSS